MFRDIIILMKKKINDSLGLAEHSKKHSHHQSTFARNKDYSTTSNASSIMSPMYTPKEVIKK